MESEKKCKCRCQPNPTGELLNRAGGERGGGVGAAAAGGHVGAGDSGDAAVAALLLLGNSGAQGGGGEGGGHGGHGWSECGRKWRSGWNISEGRKGANVCAGNDPLLLESLPAFYRD
jgi:hypothetical protein